MFRSRLSPPAPYLPRLNLEKSLEGSHGFLNVLFNGARTCSGGIVLGSGKVKSAGLCQAEVKVEVEAKVKARRESLMVHLRDFLNCNKLSKQSSNMPYLA
jgi:hypothetical protein